MSSTTLGLLSFEQAGHEFVRKAVAHAHALKKIPPFETRHHRGKTMLLFFEKPSTRTRISFEVAAHHLGANVVVLDPSSSQMKRGESLQDTAMVLGCYADVLTVRTFGDDRIREIATFAGKPVINALTDRYHPCQILADVMTISESFGEIRGLTLSYFGDGNNVCNSLIEAAPIFGYTLRAATPEGREPDAEVVRIARSHGATIDILHDAAAAAEGAHVLYTDVWTSMGQDESVDTSATFTPFRVDNKLMSKAAADSIFLHCLPAHRGQEVTADVIDGRRSRIRQQAENRLHLQRGVLDLLLSR